MPPPPMTFNSSPALSPLYPPASPAPLLGNHATSSTSPSPIPSPYLGPPPPYDPPTASGASPLPQYVNPYNDNSSSGDTKLGPVAQERRRRKRKLAFCIVFLCAVLVILVSLIVGIIMGLVDVKHQG